LETFFWSETVVRRLDMDKTQGIEQLFASGRTKRQIARTLGINRKSVDRHLAALPSKGATVDEALTGESPTGSEISKGAKALTGFTPIHAVALAAKEGDSVPVQSRSECARYRDQIIVKIEQGLTAQRIYQDLVTDYEFSAKYHSVRRYVGSLIHSKELPVRRIEVEAAQRKIRLTRFIVAFKYRRDLNFLRLLTSFRLTMTGN
jgi:hypothetical protein